jgi:hypothetical protein
MALLPSSTLEAGLMTPPSTEPAAFRLIATRYNTDVHVAWFSQSPGEYLGSLWMSFDLWELLKCWLSILDTYREVPAAKSRYSVTES